MTLRSLVAYLPLPLPAHPLPRMLSAPRVEGGEGALVPASTVVAGPPPNWLCSCYFAWRLLQLQARTCFRALSRPGSPKPPFHAPGSSAALMRALLS